MNSQVLDDGTSAFISSDQEVGIVIHEKEGEILRLEGDEVTFDQLVLARFIQVNEPLCRNEILKEFDATDKLVVRCLDTLFERGQVCEKKPDQIRIVTDPEDDSEEGRQNSFRND